jgi:hypothetical protein
MSNLSDKDIDRLSRDAAEFYEPDDSMLSWNKLEQQLVNHIPERPPDGPSLFRIRPLIWGPSVLLLAGISYFIIKNTAYRRDSTLQAQKENLIAKPADPSRLSGKEKAPAPALNPQESDPANAQALKSNSAKSNSGNKISRNSGGEEAVTNAGTGVSAQKENHPDRSPNNPDASPNSIIPGKNTGTPGQWNQNANAGNRLRRQPGLSGEAKAISNDPLSGNAQTGFAAGESEANGKQNATAGYFGIAHLPSPAMFLSQPEVRGNDSSLNRFAARDKKPELKSLQVNHSLVIGLLMGPDYTDVGTMSNNQLGNNIGLSLGYYLRGRLSVNTGFQYTSKYYWSDGKPFQPQPQRQPLNTMISMYAPFPQIETVNGRSSMFEIPLTLRYDIYRHDKLTLFVNAGASSYLLRKQHYTYFFHNAGQAYEWQNKNNDHLNYWFAVGNISAGIEQDLGKGFSFQAEPFVRLPFRGIGVGNLKMNSYGLLFSVRYSPVLGRKRK